MNRPRRYVQNNKPFVSGGVYNPQSQYQPQNPQQQQQQQQQRYQQPNYQQQQRSSQQYQQQTQPQPQRQYQQKQPLNQQLKHEEERQYQNQVVVDKHDDEEEHDQEQEEECEENSEAMAEDTNDSIETERTCVESLTDEKGKLLYKKIFLNRKKSSVRAREKKIRQNRRLRKAITPKNALMALNEVKNIQMSDFTVSNIPSGGFLTVVTINGNQYEGRGHSKAAAKNNACEKALRDYVIAKMITKPRLKTQSESNLESMDTEETEEQSKDIAGGNDDEDDVPMVNLASFALYKLFSEWESEGFVIPEMHPSVPNGAEANGGAANKDVKKSPPIRSELPENWETMHPATLLCMMRPGLTYNELGTIGEKPNVMQKVGIVVDEQEFFGEGRSKKLARRNTAVSVCNALFGTNFAFDTL